MLETLDTTDTTRISWGQKIEKFNLQEVDLELTAQESPNRWEHAISAVDAISIYTDGSRAEDGTVGGGNYLSQGKLGVRVGKMATVWDGEVAGLERGIIAATNRDWKILLLSDSKAAIQAIRNAGVTGKGRTRVLARLGKEIKDREKTYGVDNTLIAWVKSHIGIKGNEEADEMAKLGSMKEKGGEITEGGIRQASKEKRRAKRSITEYLCMAGWDRKTAITYIQLRTNKGNLRCWTHLIGKSRTDACKKCGEEIETGDHVMFSCPAWEHLRPKRWIKKVWRMWECWEDLELKVWVDKREEGEPDVNHIHIFLSKFGL